LNVLKIQNFAIAAYSRNSDEFIERYGSIDGLINLADDLKKELNINSVGQELVTFFNSSTIEDFLGVEDKRFKEYWNPARVTLTRKQKDAFLHLVKEKYEILGEAFFLKYGSRQGGIILARDLAKMGYGMNLNILNSFIKNPELMAKVCDLDINDFKDWNPKSILLSLEQIDRISDLLKKEYAKGKEYFMEEFGGVLGISNLQDRLKKELQIRSNANAITSLVKDPEVLAYILNIDSNDLVGYNPRYISSELNNKTAILNLFREEYQRDSDHFFEAYGSKLGPLKITELIKRKTGVKHNFTLLKTMFNSGTTLEALLEVSDDRFRTSWKHGQIEGTYDEVMNTINFLKKKYFQDTRLFFERYGIESGIVNLYDDILNEAGYRASKHLLDTVTRKKIIKDILGVQDNKQFRENWDPKNIGVSCDTIKLAVDYLKFKYDMDSDSFFEIYGNKAGLIVLLEELKQKYGLKRKFQDASNAFFSNWKIISQLISNEDRTFEENWEKKYSAPTLWVSEVKYFTNLVAGGKSLPDIKDKFTEEDIDYIRLRKLLTKTCTGKAIKYIVELFTGDKDSSKHIEDSIKEDYKVLQTLKPIETFEGISKSEEQKLLYKAGRLLYSFDEKVREQTSSWLIKTHSYFAEKYQVPFIDEALTHCSSHMDVYAIKLKYNVDRVGKLTNFIYTAARYFKLMQSTNKEISLDAVIGDEEGGAETYNRISLKV